MNTGRAQDAHEVVVGQMERATGARHMLLLRNEVSSGDVDTRSNLLSKMKQF
jgi:hypothetical protein